jgi:hypothetical protein
MNTIQLTVGEIEISLYANKSEHAGLVHFGEATVDVEYEFQPGEREIMRADPNDSQPGWPDAITIGSIKLIAPMEFAAESITTVFDAGYDIFHLLSKNRIEQMEEQILTSVREEVFA